MGSISQSIVTKKELCKNSRLVQLNNLVAKIMRLDILFKWMLRVITASMTLMKVEIPHIIVLRIFNGQSVKVLNSMPSFNSSVFRIVFFIELIQHYIYPLSNWINLADTSAHFSYIFFLCLFTNNIGLHWKALKQANLIFKVRLSGWFRSKQERGRLNPLGSSVLM